MYNPSCYDWNMPTGWRCPRCGTIMGPFYDFCTYCSNEEGTIQTTDIGINDIKVYKNNSTYYPKVAQEKESENMGWRDWLDTTREQIRKEANLK